MAKLLEGLTKARMVALNARCKPARGLRAGEKDGHHDVRVCKLTDDTSILGPDCTPAPDAGGEQAVPAGKAEDRNKLIVGIGASAGGIDALKTFFSEMPSDIGMGFVIVQHLDPNYESSLTAIIAGYTTMPVHVAENGALVVPNHVFVIPPDTILTIKEGRLRLSQPAPPAARRTSVNTFLSSLAEDQAENAVAIILSGFGSDGALGIAAIKEHGGLSLSQAEFDHHAKRGMPQSAASAGFVDHVLPVEKMPQALLDYRHHRAINDSYKGPDGIRQDLPSHLATICAVLHSRLGRDFSDYKTGTLMRRIQRRMHVLQTDKVAEYIDQLRSLPHEAEQLFRELLISVTRFFRDRQAFEELEAKVIPGLLLGDDQAAPIRIWIAGCATGEEAYSIAILMKEALHRADSRRPVQIFATDVDDQAIAVARAGLYPTTIAADVSPERLALNFAKEDGSYRVAKDIREMCLFSTHDLVKDPPFSRIDLISCRNLLIYFEPALQQRVITTFHYALRSGRCLFLGPSESIASQAQLFAPLDKRQRLFVRRDTAAKFPVVSLSRHFEETLVKRIAPPPADGIDRRAARAMARYAPAFLVVNSQQEVVRFSGETGKFLQPASGVASLSLFTLLHLNLRSAVRAALNEATATGERVLYEHVDFEAGDHKETINLIVEPLASSDDNGLFVIAFQEAKPPASLAKEPKGSAPGRASGSTAALKQEVRISKERLRNLSEELETTNEELQSSNEEYLSVNEELQSANEELVTSKEELQSLNEELQTINAELNNRNERLVRSNSDLANLFDSTSIATLFLDRDMRIRRFTPRLLEIFSLREGDEGRPISDIVTNLTREGLGQDVQQVLKTFMPREREVEIVENGAPFLMQVRPYRDLNNVVDGVVVTFVDLSERKRDEQARSRLAAIVDSSQDAIIGHDLRGTVISWNDGAQRLFGTTANEAIGQSMPSLVWDALPCKWPEMLEMLERGEQLPAFECTNAGAGGHALDVSVTISPVKEVSGRITGVSLVARDIRTRKAAEQKTTLLLGELDHRVKNILSIVSAVVSQTLKTTATPELFALEVEGRVQAIAKAHSLLTHSGLGEVSLRDILHIELAPYDRGNISIPVSGGDIALTPRAGLALAMAIHELASNAAKYGALSTEAGRLTVAWDILSDSTNLSMTLVWAETGGPTVSPPTRRGFGTTLIERALFHELDAEVSRDFAAQGLRCTIVLPLTPEFGRVLTGDTAGPQ